MPGELERKRAGERNGAARDSLFSFFLKHVFFLPRCLNHSPREKEMGSQVNRSIKVLMSLETLHLKKETTMAGGTHTPRKPMKVDKQAKGRNKDG